MYTKKRIYSCRKSTKHINVALEKIMIRHMQESLRQNFDSEVMNINLAKHVLPMMYIPIYTYNHAL